MEEKKWKYIFITVMLVALIAVFAFNSGGLNDGSYLLIAILIFPLGALAFILVANAKKKREAQERLEEENRRKREQQAAEFRMKNEKLAAAIKRYNARLQELGYEKKNLANLTTVYKKYTNSDNFYPEYLWSYQNKILRIRQEPTINNYDDPAYEDPSLINVFHFEKEKINYITVEGNLCVLYYEWKPFYFRNDAIDTFRRMLPDKIK